LSICFGPSLAGCPVLSEYRYSKIYAMLSINSDEQKLLLEALEDLMFKISMQSQSFKGKPNTTERKKLTQRQNRVEALQHKISILEETK